MQWRHSKSVGMQHPQGIAIVIMVLHPRQRSNVHWTRTPASSSPELKTEARACKLEDIQGLLPGIFSEPGTPLQGRKGVDQAPAWTAGPADSRETSVSLAGQVPARQASR